MKWLLAIGVLILPMTARADVVEWVPIAGWVWGGTERFELANARGSVHLDAAPEYGGSLGAFGRSYGIEILYHYQGSEVVVRADGRGEVGRIDASVHAVLLQVVRQYHWAGLVPFLTVGFGGAGFYAVGSSDWEYQCSAGAGIRRPFDHGGSLRLMVRMLAPVEIARNGFSFGAGNSGVVVGGTNRFFQGDVNLGYSIPLWRSH